MGTRQGASVFSTDRQRQIARTLYADGDAAYDLFDDVAGGRYDAVQVTCRPGAPLSASLTLLVGSSAFVQADDMANKDTVKVR